jgi:hypothetical protein
MKLSKWDETLIIVTLTEFFFGASPVQVDPNFALGVIFDTRICFIVQTIQCTTDYRMEVALL